MIYNIYIYLILHLYVYKYICIFLFLQRYYRAMWDFFKKGKMTMLALLCFLPCIFLSMYFSNRKLRFLKKILLLFI